jgi:hypothetical protein
MKICGTALVLNLQMYLIAKMIVGAKLTTVCATFATAIVGIASWNVGVDFKLLKSRLPMILNF